MLVEPRLVSVLEQLNLQSQRVVNFRGRVWLPESDLGIKLVLDPIIFPFILLRSIKLDSL